MKITAKWTWSKATREARFTATGDAGPEGGEVVLDTVEHADLRPLVLRAGLASWGEFSATAAPDATRPDARINIGARDTALEVADVVAALAVIADETDAHRASEAARVAALAAEEEAAAAKRAARVAAIEADVEGYVRGLPTRQSFVSDLGWPTRTLHGISDNLNARLRAAAGAEAERRAATAAATKAQRGEARAQWVREHGSARLRAALEAGLLEQSERTYRDERRALERPGYAQVRQSEDEREIREPSEASLAALLAERAVYPEAVIDLVYLVRPHAEACYEDGEGCVPGCPHAAGPALVMGWETTDGTLSERIARRR